MFPVRSPYSEENDDEIASNLIPRTERPPMSVQFIDNDLADLHAALRNPLSTFDSLSGRYVELSLSAELARMETIMSPSTDEIIGGGSDSTQIQEFVPTVTPMAFWERIFQVSLERFNSLWPDEPHDRVKSGWNYSIRKSSTWEDVYAQLQKAREFYDGDTKGLWGRYAKSYTKKRRWFIDHTTPIARQGVKFVPQIDYATPVVAAVQVLVDAFETTSRVRGTMTAGLDRDDLEKKFSGIEVFLATFPKDLAIKEASVQLIAATLKAIEDVIGFFLESNAKKAMSATLRGKDYQKKPLESIEQIRIRSEELLQAAQKSHIAETKQMLDVVLKEKLDKRECSDAFLRNTLMDFLNEAQEQKRRELDEKERELEEKRKLTENITHLKGSLFRLTEQVERLKGTTPTPSPAPLFTSPTTFSLTMPVSPMNLSGPNPPTSFPHGSQGIMYPPNVPWAASPRHSDDQQPLPFAANSQRNIPIRFDIVALELLLRNFELIDEVDLNAILEDEEQSIAFREKRKADLVVSTKQFHDWMVSNKSSELLIHGEFRRSRSASEPVSALSVFCATLTQTFRKSGHEQIALVFFCGCHTERDDQHRGPAVMICSFIAQLAKSWPFDVTTLQNNQLNVYSQEEVERMVKDENLPKLCDLFRFLVILLPDSATLICIIDGILHYETDELEEGLLKVLGFLLNLARNGDTDATVKVLASSPTTTDLVQTRFKDDDSCFISLTEIRDLGQGFGSEHLEDSSDDHISGGSEESEDSDD
ncbi:hypothetical protein J7T55_010941 [Diaporthe amygdali]|uniref:uncharacterized protein n=1 Tax=Phomopsis amygdali TaxID=1214568 RepID=UPI0022FEBFC1|nr:uncharacterized protein J7T55_010941 [Diaporthe amygdali]KAJ0104475.1 hypothetical protein J7T55_010941 [Diaporthe amygdali]